MTQVLLPIDVHIGQRLRARRLEMGWSQQELAARSNLKSQQLSKYERGENRVYAAVLFDIGQHLGVGIEYFFDGEAPPIDEEYAAGLLELVKTYKQIRDPQVRTRLRELATTLKGIADAPPRR